MTAYYNENNPFAAAWLRELIKARQIAQGDVDERSIKEVQPNDLKNYTQCHFFAGIGVWSYALKKAGWSDERQVWTGSCPCQPFSVAGRRGGFDDERHLWPDFFRLIQAIKPITVFGEQVASKDGLTWLDLVSSDLEESDYTFGAVDTCAAGFGAPHIRQRLYWAGTLDNTADSRCNNSRQYISRSPLLTTRFEQSGTLSRAVGESASIGQSRGQFGDRSSIESTREEETVGGVDRKQVEERLPVGGFWSGADWVRCRDGKTRPIEPGTFPLAHGSAARVGRLRGYGNALCAEAAKSFIEAYLEVHESMNI